ncbi:hypothetical protein [Streptomyces sp. V1I1]|uniref:hypothetical protein n=1 Tax=Streptomyces sp. V1I1 TaxID=3042272 RepID=UPI00277E0848|nr:hypothetical protein [Streptomyces sp. V1I1]MDQ0943203.1 hypothetical protein [Streptomyces sp. V1I1]
MRLRYALTVGVTAAAIAPAALTAATATAATPATAVTAAAPVAPRPAAPRPAADTALTSSTATAAMTGTAAITGTAAMTGTAAAFMTRGLAARPAADAIAAPAATPQAPPADKPGEPPAATALPTQQENPAGRQPTCGKASDPDFPIDTRVLGGASVHRPGGGFEPWSVELANTTGEACQNIHPVIIFTGRDPGLTPPRITLEFYDDEAALWRPVVLETTAEGEVVGVLDGEGRFPGFAVPARKSVTAKVRLRLATDAPPNEVTVNAAVVQRQGDDGDWVGESGDYRFAVLGGDDSGIDAGVTPDELAATGTGTGSLVLLGAAFGAVLLGSGALVLASRWRPKGRR